MFILNSGSDHYNENDINLKFGYVHLIFFTPNIVTLLHTMNSNIV